MNNENKTFAYRLGQFLGAVIIICIAALIIGITVALLMRIF